MQAWMCVNCGYVYEAEHGAPESGIAPGTVWADVPDDWVCPDCGASKASFDMIEI
jgi:rubredoxin